MALSIEQRAELQIAMRGARLVGPRATFAAVWQMAVPPAARRWVVGGLLVGGAFLAATVVSRLTERAVR